MRGAVVVPVGEGESAQWRLAAQFAQGIEHHALRLVRSHRPDSAELHHEDVATGSTDPDTGGGALMFDGPDRAIVEVGVPNVTDKRRLRHRFASGVEPLIRFRPRDLSPATHPTDRPPSVYAG